MREDDYTGVPVEDNDQLSLLEDLGLYELEDDFDELALTDDDETVIHVGGAANGAASLREAAEMLYDFAEELLTLAGEGWEILDTIDNGHGVAVRIDADDAFA